jgi:hypothetical protein
MACIFRFPLCADKVSSFYFSLAGARSAIKGSYTSEKILRIVCERSDLSPKKETAKFSKIKRKRKTKAKGGKGDFALIVIDVTLCVYCVIFQIALISSTNCGVTNFLSKKKKKKKNNFHYFIVKD